MPPFLHKFRCQSRLWLAVWLLLPAFAFARGTYLTVPEFLALAYPGAEPPPVKTLWLTGELKERVDAVFGHAYNSLRVRYWQRDQRSAWVLEEIGKELPITIGVVVEGDAIEQVHILAFRESRGGEVRHRFFTEQFDRATLDDDDRLDRPIDNVTGATLSVRAVTKVARAALVLAETVDESSGEETAP